jgi:hypothetical protein
MHRPLLKSVLFATVLSAATSLAWAQLPDTVQRSSSPQGFQVQGNTPTKTTSAPSNVGLTSAGKEDAGAGTAVAAGTVKVQIQGNTRINASATNTNATALGQGNKAGNDLGGIGNK